MRLTLPVYRPLVIDFYAEQLSVSFDDTFQKSECAVAVCESVEHFKHDFVAECGHSEPITVCIVGIYRLQKRFFGKNLARSVVVFEKVPRITFFKSDFVRLESRQNVIERNLQFVLVHLFRHDCGNSEKALRFFRGHYGIEFCRMVKLKTQFFLRFFRRFITVFCGFFASFAAIFGGVFALLRQFLPLPF